MAAASAVPSAMPRVSLAGTVELLHTHLTAALCHTVFQRVRNRERQRCWTLAALAQFWITVILTAPRSLTQVLPEAGVVLPALGPAACTSPEAFFQRAERLRPHFVQALDEAFVARLVPDAPATYAAVVSGLSERFPEVWGLDGSRLDAVPHRLTLTWDVRSPLLPGCLLVLYDLCRGFPRHVAFCADAAGSELAGRLSCWRRFRRGPCSWPIASTPRSPSSRRSSQHQLWGVCRLNRRLTVRQLKVLRCIQRGGGTLTEWLAEVGCGVGAPQQRVRHICWRARRDALDLLTTVLEPARLRVEEALACCRLRWQVERLFFDLKEVLHLHHFYASSRGVAQQVYAAALIYAAMRVAQARITQAHQPPRSNCRPPSSSRVSPECR